MVNAVAAHSHAATSKKCVGAVVAAALQLLQSPAASRGRAPPTHTLLARMCAAGHAAVWPHLMAQLPRALAVAAVEGVAAVTNVWAAVRPLALQTTLAAAKRGARVADSGDPTHVTQCVVRALDLAHGTGTPVELQAVSLLEPLLVDLLAVLQLAPMRSDGGETAFASHATAVVNALEAVDSGAVFTSCHRIIVALLAARLQQLQRTSAGGCGGRVADVLAD